MSDLIYRQDAIIAVRSHRIDINDPKKIVRKSYEDVIRELPSAEPQTKLVAEVTLTKDQIQNAVDKAVEKMRAELAPCDFCKYKDDCGDMAMYCPAERRTDEQTVSE